MGQCVEGGEWNSGHSCHNEISQAHPLPQCSGISVEESEKTVNLR